MVRTDPLEHFIDQHVFCLHLADEPLEEDVRGVAVVLAEEDEGIRQNFFEFYADAIAKRGGGFCEDCAYLFCEFADEETLLIQWLLVDLQQRCDSAT